MLPHPRFASALDDAAQQTITLRPVLAPVLEGMRALVPGLDDGASVLEVGCGEGWNTGHLRDLVDGVGGRAVHLEADPWLARIGPAQAQAWARDLPVREGWADLCLMPPLSGRAVDGALDEAHRVLKPGGTLLVPIWLTGAFEVLIDLVIDAAEAADEHAWATRVRAAQRGLLLRRQLHERLTVAELVPDLITVVEHAVVCGEREDAEVAPLARAVTERLLLTNEDEPGSHLLWEAFEDAVAGYFADTVFTVAFRVALVRARRV